MDAGAHFHRCDFQVHSPRDAQWIGTHYCTTEERRAFAATFIQQCRQKGLDAVAITDHHDLTFFPYIREAACSELDDDGNPVPEDRQIVIFPGMELTLGVPCQAILILDADFEDHLLSQLYSILAIQQVDSSLPKLPANVTRLEHVTILSQLCKELDRHEFLRGRYTILPNVSDGGNATLLRSGNHGKYKEMSCVGGYVDKGVSDLGQGNRDILDGKNRQYGFKSVGVFQTSDNRREDGRDLGVHSTWVKWAVPKAEALRQACLARQTRLSHVPPQLPSVTIESIRVSNSKFLGPVDLELNPQFNCVIGGRGTGKSTILEYLRWALCDQPPVMVAADDLPDFHLKRATLIKNTLVPHEGAVTVSFLVNNVRHVVRRYSHSGELMMKIGEREFEKCREDDVRDLLPIQAYSQKQLSAVGVRREELVRFIEASVKQQLRHLMDQNDDLKRQIQNAYSLYQRKRQLERDVAQDQLEVESLGKQIESLQKGLTGLSPEDQKILARHDKIGAEQHLLETWQTEFDRASDAMRALLQDMATMPTAIGQESKYHNIDLLKEIGEQTGIVLRQAEQHIQAALQLLSGGATAAEPLLTLRRNWKGLQESHVLEHEQVKRRAAAHEAVLKQIEAISERLRTIRATLTSKSNAISELGDPEMQYGAARDSWISVYRERGDLLELKCRELTELSGGTIRATLRRGAGIETAAEKLKGFLSGTSIRSKKTEDLFNSIASGDDPVAEWGRLASELELLAQSLSNKEDTFEPPSTPMLSKFYSVSDLERIARKLTLDQWLDLSLTELDDVPSFQYRQGEIDYIDFSSASAGQQATALLRVLLNQEGPPLVIDQPEEDLDNQVMQEIVQEIWRAKRKRQIIVSSHNANIVVNGDADLVVCCDYRTSGDQSGGQIKCQGAIDVSVINREITNVMEGGKEAFRLRKAKYGF